MLYPGSFYLVMNQMNLKETFSASLASKEETLFLLKKIQISEEILDMKFSQKITEKYCEIW